MFNVTVLRLKDIVKYIICIFVLILLIFSITNYFSGTKKNTEQVTQKVGDAVFSGIRKFLDKKDRTTSDSGIQEDGE